MSPPTSRRTGALPTLICPRCRRPPLGWPILHDGLQCSNADCGHRYPTLARTGIPVVQSGPIESVLEFDAPVDFADVDDVEAWLISLEPGSATWELALRTGMYATSHYDSDRPLATALYERFLADLPATPGTVIELGCGVGGLGNLIASRSACDIVGLDAVGLALRLAEAAGEGGRIAVPELRDGVRLAARPLDVTGTAGSGRVDWLCADVHDPPLMPAAYDLVVAVNLFDSTPEPTVALGQAAALVAPGGYLLMAQPDAWNAQATPAGRWLPSADQTWDGLLAAHGLQVVDRDDGFVWRLQRTPRFGFEYVSHARLARRPDVID